RRQIVEPLGQLLELPVLRQRRRFVPGRLLPAEPRQWRLAVHGGDRSEQSQILRLRRKATRLKSVLQRAVCPQYLCCSRCSQSRAPRRVARRAPTQRDETGTGVGIDSVAGAALGGTDPRALACANWIKNRRAAGGELERIAAAAGEEDGAAPPLFGRNRGGKE